MAYRCHRCTSSRFAASYNLDLGGSGNKELVRRRERYKMDGLSQNAIAWAHNPVPLENKTRAMLDSAKKRSKGEMDRLDEILGRNHLLKSGDLAEADDDLVL